ncbi:Oidioi.mRNA.OKI2018_I69.PAR.g9143.t3.cds [Oikopleura dioica]|uniref:Oidioi.mRNA.OKI2018_I69.PAR.g9143.t3.cds n=1 Tax=Oikopleura dioica TaxID=34765 RepID=A0ABN7RQ26_OIKDI|nr:Oidioi.mRNA.OKI2018_I69.PAR.g9143.t3.cds [Oikopleura dioica]
MCCLDDNYRKNGALAGLFVVGNALASFYLILTFLMITDNLCKYLLFVFSSFSLIMGFLTLMAVVRMSEVLRRDTFLRRLILAFIGIGFILVPVCCWRLFNFMSHMEEITVGGKVANDRSLAVYVELGLLIFHGILSCFIVCSIHEAKQTRHYFEREAKYNYVENTQTGNSERFLTAAVKGGPLVDDEEGSNASYDLDDPERRGSDENEEYSDGMVSEESVNSEKHLTREEMRQRGLLAMKQKRGLGRRGSEDSDFYDEEKESYASRKRSSEGSSALLLVNDKTTNDKRNLAASRQAGMTNSRVSGFSTGRGGGYQGRALPRPESIEPAELELGASDDEARHLEFIDFKSDFNRRSSNRTSTSKTLPDLNHPVREKSKRKSKPVKASKRVETDEENE